MKILSAIAFAASLLCLAVYAEDAKPDLVRSAGLPVAELKRETPVDFEKEVLPLLKNSCLACHNTTKAKGGLNLETPQLITKGGETGPAVVPGKSAESLFFKAASHLDPELIMPPKDNKANAPNFSPEQLALVKLWIEQGARGEVRAATPVKWLDKPPALDPIFAVALTQDGQFAACGRGNRIDVYHVPSGQIVARLADAKLAGAGLTNSAHRDVVNSLAFNPEGTLLASASFREVKLWRRPRDVRQPLPVLTNSTAVLAVSPDRRWLATATAEHVIALHDLLNAGHVVRALTGHSNTITSLKFSPDSAQLCSGSADQTLRLWKVSDGSRVTSIDAVSPVHAVTWMAEGRQIASGGVDGIIRIWSAPKLDAVKELKGHTNALTALDVLPDGQQLLSGGSDGTLRQWNVGEGKVIRELVQDSPVTALAIRADGKRFASAGTNNSTKLWNAIDGKLVSTMKGDRYAEEFVAHTERALTVAKADGEFYKKALDAAEAESKKQTERVATATATNTFTEKVFLEKEKALKEAQVAQSAAEKALDTLLAEIKTAIESFENADKSAKDAALKARATGTKATETQIAAERTALSRIDVEKMAIEMAAVAARSKVAAGNADAEKDTARRIAEESAAVAEKSKAFADAVAADADMKSKLAADARAAAEKAIDDLASLSFAAGQLKPAYDRTLAESPGKRKAATNQIETARKSVDGADKEFKRAETRKSVTGHELELALQSAGRASNSALTAKSTLDTVESRQKQTAADLDARKKAAAASVRPVQSIAFSPDGRTLATLGDDGRVHTWSAENGAAFDVFPSALPNSDSLPASPGSVSFLDATSVVAFTEGREATVWNLNPAWTFERAIGSGDVDSPLHDRVNAVRFSPDGKLLATGSGEPTRSGEIKLWNVDDGKLDREFSNIHSDAVLGLDFSPDGKSLASSSADRFARVIDLATGKIVRAFEGHTSYVLGVAWKADSRTLASAGADNVIKVWDFVTGERRKNIEGATKEVTSIAYVGVSDQAVAASGDNQVRLLKENGDKVRSFEGAADFMQSVAVTPDGRLVVAGGQDGVLRIWNGAGGEVIASLTPSQKQ